MKDCDVVVIGGGPGGYVAAIRAAQLGNSVTLAEKDQLGGVCLNWGCVPTKALLRSAEILDLINNSSDYGIEVSKVNLDLKKMVARSRSISSKLSSNIKSLLKKNNINIINGVAKVSQNKVVEVISNDESFVLKAKNIILATGARVKSLSFLENISSEKVWTSKEAMVPDELPKSLFIIGAGSIGMEFASFYNSLGTNIILVEAQNRVLPTEDLELSKFAKESFERKGIKIYTGTQILNCVEFEDYVNIEILSNGKTYEFKVEKILLAAGITGNIENLGLENTKVKIKNGYILTNTLLQTDESGIYAIGDVAGAPCLAHKASHEGVIAAEVISGVHANPIIKSRIPKCTYSSPQIASIGLTEEEAVKEGHNIKVGKFPFAANSKAIILKEAGGFIKTIFSADNGELLGVHMIGPEVTELIQACAIAMNLESTELDLMNTIFPHPTLSEVLYESILQSQNRAINI